MKATTLLALLASLVPLAQAKPYTRWRPEDAPAQAQVIDPRTFNVLENVAPQDQFDGASVSLPSHLSVYGDAALLRRFCHCRALCGSSSTG